MKQPDSLSSTFKRRVLSAGANAELLWLRDAVLRYAGFEVFTTSNQKDIVGEVQAGRCDILLLCHSLDEGFRHDVAKQFRESRPTGRIVSITNDKVSEIPPYLDALVYGIEGPEALIAALNGKEMPDKAA